jgi:maltooligosyltrehalose trehalohydrolase
MGEEYAEDAPFSFFCSFADKQLVENVRRGRRREFEAFAWQGEVPDPQDEATFMASRLSWSWPAGSARSALRRLYQDLLIARRAWPAMRDFHHRTARLLPDQGTSVLELVRGGCSTESEVIQAFFNLTRQPHTTDEVRPGWKVLFRSEAVLYGGGRGETARERELLPYECVVHGPANWTAFV